MTQPNQATIEFPIPMIALLRCSRDGGQLLLCDDHETGRPGVSQGSLRCAVCAGEFLIRDGIVRLLPETLSIADALKDDGWFVGGVEHDDLTRRLVGEPIARRYTTGGIFD